MNPTGLQAKDPISHPESSELRRCALQLLCVADPVAKADGTRSLAAAWLAGECALASAAVLQPADLTIPGRPLRPVLVSPKLVKRRAMTTVEGRAAMVHALAHIEFNAINLALDAVWRYPGMPDDFYADWIRVAGEEALHFTLLCAHLQTLGAAYGDFEAHGSLWEMAEKTRDDVLARMALVPRTLEARGLDASPLMRAKLAQAGDQAAADILDIILRDEIGHVAVGNRWYGWLCAQLGREALATYPELVLQYKAPQLRGPFNLDARRAAGFTEAELDALGR
jgi:uncharacterized ferritin-like protein (DUF455 family)